MKNGKYVYEWPQDNKTVKKSSLKLKFWKLNHGNQQQHQHGEQPIQLSKGIFPLMIHNTDSGLSQAYPMILRFHLCMGGICSDKRTSHNCNYAFPAAEGMQVKNPTGFEPLKIKQEANLDTQLAKIMGLLTG